ncbi:hypothetical protein H1R20_g4134, partial [Candolleomyces eurysporus]
MALKTTLSLPQSMEEMLDVAMIYTLQETLARYLNRPDHLNLKARDTHIFGSISTLSTAIGRYLVTAGHDGKVKVWDCRNWKGVVREWSVHGAGDVELEWSQKGYLGVLSGGSVNVYHPPHIITSHGASLAPPPLYLTHPVPHRPLTSLRFEPFSDVLAIGHNKGLTSIIVPGAGEPQFDSYKADPFESSKQRREREIKGLLDKIQPDLITLDPLFTGKFDTSSVSALSSSLVATTVQSLLDKSDNLKRPQGPISCLL